MTQPKLYILVGIPGCGKTTYADHHLDGYTVSSDEIRARLGDVNDQTRNGQVFNIFHAEIAWNLGQEENVVADSTALDPRSRKTLRTLAEIFHAETHLVYWTNLHEAFARNERRVRVVPADVMERMLDKYEQFRLDLLSEAHHYTSITQIGHMS